MKNSWKIRKLWYRSLLCLAMLLLSVLSFSGCGDAAQDDKGTAGTEKGEVTDNKKDGIDLNTDDAVDELVDKVEDITDDDLAEGRAFRENKNAVLTTLNTGNFTVGPDIPEGRYTITGNGSGNIVIYSDDGDLEVNEILGGEIGVKSVTTDLEEGDTIEISGIKEATFTPYETTMKQDSLTTGDWIVGIDFEPGRYDVTSTGGNGNFFVYDDSDFPVVNEILGGGEFGVEKVTVNLKDGYVISIQGMNEVKFEAR